MMPRIYIRDQNDEVLDTLDEGQYFDDNMQRFLKGKATVLSFSLVKTEDSYELMTTGRNVSFRFDDEDFWLNCVIVEQDETYLTVTAWSLGLEFNNETIGAYKAPKAMTFAEYLAIIDVERVLTLGINEVADKKITHEWESTENKLSRLYSLATVFNAELSFDTKLNDDGSLNQITLNVYREYSDTDHGLGQDRRNETFYFGEDIKTIRKTEDKTELYTAIYAIGKDGLTIAGIEKEIFDEDGNLLFATYKTPKAGFPDPKTLYAPQSREQFPSNTSGGDRWTLHVAGEFEYATAEALLGYMMSELKKHYQPATTWEIEGYIKAKIGDTVRVADEGYKPTLFLEARVTEQELSFTDETKKKTTFSNVVELESQVDSSLLDRVQALIEANKTYQYSISTDNGIVFKNNTGTTTLTAMVRDGVADVTANFAISWFKDGEAIGRSGNVTVSATEVEEKAVYRFEAVKADGTVVGGYEVTVSDVSDGESGEPGRGIDGDPETTFAKSTNGTMPPSTWVTDRPEVPAGQFLWTKTTTKYTDDTESSTIIPTLMGPKGEDGNGIKSTKTEYQASTSGTTPPTGTWTAGIPDVSSNQYLWTRVVLTFTDDTTATFHSVGKMGANGSASYFHTAWADNDTGTEGFSLTESLGKKYIGTYADNTQAGSTDPAKYNWVELANAIDLHTAYKMADETFSKAEPGLNLMSTESVSPYHAGSTNSWSKIANGQVDYSRKAATNGGLYIDDGAVLEENSDYVVHFKITETTAEKVVMNGLIYTPFDGLINERAYLDGVLLPNNGVGASGTVTFDLTDGLEHDILLTFSTPSVGEWSQSTYQGHILQLLKSTATAYSVSVKLLKFEKSNAATIYTPTQSEDWANAIPKYVGTCTKDSDDPDDYTWTLNPEWVQMSSDKGLEDKLGNDQYLDDKGEIWTEIGNKVSQEEANEIRDMANSIESSLSAFLDDGGQYESDLASLEARTQGLVEQLGDQLATYEFLKTYISLGEEGLVIGSHDSTLKVLLSNGQLAFVDGGQTVAYFASQKFYINSGAVVESLQIGYHKITSLDKDNTVIQFIQS